MVFLLLPRLQNLVALTCHSRVCNLLKKKNKHGYQMTLEYPPKIVPIPSKARNETNVRILQWKSRN